MFIFIFVRSLFAPRIWPLWSFWPTGQISLKDALGARERTMNAKQKHHEQTQATQIKLAKQVESLVSTIADHGNPFEEESGDLFLLHTKVSVDKNLVSKLQTAMEQGHTQFSSFVQSQFIDKSIDLEDKIPRNKNKIFTTQVTKKINNGKMRLVEAR